MCVCQFTWVMSNSLDCSPTGSCVHRIFPGKNTGVGCMPSSRGSSQSRDGTHFSRVSPALAGRFLATWGAHPSVDKWLNELWCIQILEYYSALKRNELPSHGKTWNNLKFVSLSERSQYEKATYCIIPAIRHSGKGKITGIVKRLVVVIECRQGDINRRRQIFRTVEIVCIILISLYICQHHYNVEHQEWTLG